MKKLKVMVCCNVYPPGFLGGAEIIAHNQAKMLQKLGHEVLVFSGDIRYREDKYRPLLEEFDGINVHRIRLVPEDYDLTKALFAHKEIERQFASILDEFYPDVVHFHNIIGFSVKIIAMAKEFGSRTVLTVHDHWGFCLKNTILKDDGSICDDFAMCHNCMSHITPEEKGIAPLRLRSDYFTLMFSYLDLIISPSEYLANAYLSVGNRNVKTIKNGMNVAKYSRIEKICSDKVRFTFAGSFARHKGVILILKALTKLEKKENVQVNLVGTGQELELYETFVAENNLFDYVKFWGRIPFNEMGRVYKETDVLILPSIWPENQPVSITEALAASIPAIVSDVGGSKELVVNGKTGYVFENGNYEMLAQKMQCLIDDPELITEYGKNAYDSICDNTYERSADLIIEEYYKLLSGLDNCTHAKIIAMNNLLPSVDEVDSINLLNLSEEYLLTYKGWLTDKQQSEIDALIILDEDECIENYYQQMCDNKLIFALVSEKNAELSLLGRFSNGLVLVRNYQELYEMLGLYIKQPEIFDGFKEDLTKYILTVSA